jgi:hypothetical protein
MPSRTNSPLPFVLVAIPVPSTVTRIPEVPDIARTALLDVLALPTTVPRIVAPTPGTSEGRKAFGDEPQAETKTQAARAADRPRACRMM